MTLHVPIKELVQSELISKTQADVETAIQTMVNHVETKQAVSMIGNLIVQLQSYQKLLINNAVENNVEGVRKREDKRMQR